VYRRSQPAGDYKSSTWLYCHHFPPGLWLPSQPQSITAPSLYLTGILNYITWWQRHIHVCVNNLPKVVTQLLPRAYGSDRKSNVLPVAPPRHRESIISKGYYLKIYLTENRTVGVRPTWRLSGWAPKTRITPLSDTLSLYGPLRQFYFRGCKTLDFFTTRAYVTFALTVRVEMTVYLLTYFMAATGWARLGLT